MYDGLMVMDFFDDCIIGIVKGIDNQDKVCYSYRKVIAKLMREDDMTEEDLSKHNNLMNQHTNERVKVGGYLKPLL